MKQSHLLIFTVIIMFIVIGAVPDNQRGIEKTIYFSYCSDSTHNVFSCPAELRVIKIVYKVYPDTQHVVSDNLTNISACRVFDENNWECRVHQDNVISMRDGSYYEELAYDQGSLDENGQKSIFPKSLQVSSFEYYIGKTVEFFRRWF